MSDESVRWHVMRKLVPVTGSGPAAGSVSATGAGLAVGLKRRIGEADQAEERNLPDVDARQILLDADQTDG